MGRDMTVTNLLFHDQLDVDELKIPGFKLWTMIRKMWFQIWALSTFYATVAKRRGELYESDQPMTK